MGQDKDNIINTNTADTGSNNNINNNNYPNLDYEALERYRNSLTGEERTEQARRAGRASQEAQKRRKSFQEQARALLERTASRESVSNVLGDSATEFFPEGQASAGELLLARMMLEGWNGNTRAAEFTRDTAGYKPTQEISVEGMDDAARSLLDNVAKRLEKESKQG
jgi:hypothetical protein